MELTGYVSLAILLVIWMASLLKLIPKGRFPFLAAFLLLAAALFWASRQQFLLWQNNEISKFLIPPYAPINYFVYYTFTRLWLPYLVSGVAGLVGLWVAVFFNRKYGGRFFYDEEPYYPALGLFLTDHPGWILYLILSLAVYLVLVIACPPKPREAGRRWGYWILKKETQRVSFYYLWLPLAAITIPLDAWLLKFEFYSNLIL